ncbi:diphthine synthase [Candidatus Pacearchaeota archaeon]|nr:diphthine synthase [Candidatus Pacearchaeota archaeon]
MLYLIGLGLEIQGISQKGLNIVKRCKRVYVENYTVDFPYSIGELKDFLDKKIIPAEREFVEGLSIVDEAQKMEVALLVYGNPLIATTHVSLMQEAKRLGIKCKIIHNASILDAVAETGLQIYKFGKITSMPAWDEKKNFVPESFMETVIQNKSINAHSLILIDIGLDFQKALEQLKISMKNHNMNIKQIVVCQRLGTKNQKFFYGPISRFEEFTGVKSPFCIIIPGKLHFVEREILEEH